MYTTEHIAAAIESIHPLTIADVPHITAVPAVGQFVVMRDQL